MDRTRLAAVAATLCATSCADDAPPDVTREAIAARVGAAIAAAAAAAGDEGQSFFDNFLPCPRRGVMSYHNVEFGRAVSFHGCDLGAGVVVNGTGEVRWHTSPLEPREPLCDAGPDPECIAALEWTGPLIVPGPDRSVFQPNPLALHLEWSPGGIGFPSDLRVETGGLGIAALVVTWDESEFVTEPALVIPDAFAPAPAVDALDGGLSAFTETDLRRVAFHAAMELASFLVDETLETGRGRTRTRPSAERRR